MDKAWEPVLTRNNGVGEVRFTVTPELVAREIEIEHPTAADIRRWLEANAEAAERAAFLWILAHPMHPVREDGTSTWDGIVRLGLADYPPA